MVMAILLKLGTLMCRLGSMVMVIKLNKKMSKMGLKVKLLLCIIMAILINCLKMLILRIIITHKITIIITEFKIILASIIEIIQTAT